MSGWLITDIRLEVTESKIGNRWFLCDTDAAKFCIQLNWIFIFVALSQIFVYSKNDLDAGQKVLT